MVLPKLKYHVLLKYFTILSFCLEYLKNLDLLQLVISFLIFIKSFMTLSLCYIPLIKGLLISTKMQNEQLIIDELIVRFRLLAYQDHSILLFWSTFKVHFEVLNFVQMISIYHEYHK